jgi:4-amino-4-deoxy-L-arabinose transferase-like glycosyltransferase
MNLVPLLFSLLLLAALYLLASKFFPDARLLFFVLLALNYLYGIFSRINDQVMPMTFFVIPAIYFFLKAWDRSPYFLLTSLFLGLSFLSKSKMIYFHAAVIPLAFLLITIQRGELRDPRLLAKRVGYFLAGVLSIAIPWYVLVFSRYPTVFRNIAALNTEAAWPGGLGMALGNWLRKPPLSFYPTNRPLTFVLFFYVLALLIVLFDKKSKAKLAPLEIVCSLWLLIGLGANSFIGYRPIRHYVEFTIPMLILVSLFLTRLLKGWRSDALLKKRGLFFAVLFVLMWTALSSFAKRIFSPEDMAGHKDKVLLLSLFLAAALAALLLIALDKGLRTGRLAVSKKAAAAAAILFAAVYIYQNIAEYVAWAGNPSFNLRTIGRDLGKAFPDGVFSGLLVPSLSLENRNPAHTFYPGYANDDPGFLKREVVTHLFLGEFNDEPSKYVAFFPEVMDRARLLVRYWLWRSWFYLYDIREGPRPPDQPGVLEAEIMERETGMPLFDPLASGRFAVRVETLKPQIIGMKKTQFPAAGKFRGRLWIRTEGREPDEAAILLRLIRKGIVIYEKKIALLWTQGESGYQPYPFDGFLPNEGPCVIEIRASGKGVFFFDKFEIALPGQSLPD